LVLMPRFISPKPTKISTDKADFRTFVKYLEAGFKMMREKTVVGIQKY